MGRGETRDNQRQRLYDAEHSCHPWRQTIPTADLQAWVDDLMAMRAIQSRWGQIKITVQLTHGGGRAQIWGRVIRLGVAARNEWVILHEIAHQLVGTHHVADHGKEFAGIMLFLVKTRLGTAEWEKLRAAFKEHRVRYNNDLIPAPGKRVVTKTERQRKAAAAKRVEREQQQRAQQALLKPQHATDAARTLRAHIAAGTYGPAGSTARLKAMATARVLEGIR